MNYYAQYSSSTSGTTGCVKRFISQLRTNPVFPPQVHYRCDICKTEHGFRLASIHQVATPLQAKQFAQYCERHHLERDVDVPHRNQ